MQEQSKSRSFTGWHMTAILVAFFTVVVMVNFTMAGFALSTFGGTVVDNSYVASQHYNEWLKRADAQKKLGWNQSITLDAQRHVRLDIRKDDERLHFDRLNAELSHPLGRVPPITLHFQRTSNGDLRSIEVLPEGRWRLDLLVVNGQD